MKKVLALVLAVIMVCTMAFAATTGTKTTTTVAVKGYTQYALNGQGVFVKETDTIKAIVKTTQGNDVADDGTTTNPGTGANDVVGVAAALAVVALVSGAAISLKK